MSELRKSQSRVENIMIAGGGNVGTILAAKLSEKFSTKIIEKDQSRSKYLSETLEGVVVLNDDISDESLLENEGIKDVDFFCSVTNDDQMNILSSKLAKDLGAKKSIAIINKPSYRKLVSKEIDVVVSPEALTILQSASTSTFARTTEGSFEAPTNTKFVGTLNGTVKVFVDNYAADGTDVLVGYKGSSETDAPAFYCPYVPLMSTGPVMDPATFEPVVSFMTRYGYKELTNTASSLGNAADYVDHISLSNVAFQ